MQQAVQAIGSAATAPLAPAPAPIMPEPAAPAPLAPEQLAPAPVAPAAIVPAPVPVAPAPLAPEAIFPAPVPVAPVPATPAPAPMPAAPGSAPPAPAPAMFPEEEDERDRNRDRDRDDQDDVDPDFAGPAQYEMEFPPEVADGYEADVGDATYQDSSYGNPYDPYGDASGGEYPYPDDGGYDPGREERIRRRLLQEPTPEACGPLPDLITWESGGVYTITPVDPPQPRRLPGVRQFLDATRPIGGTKKMQSKLGAPAILPDAFRTPSEYDPLHVCSWRRVLCGPDGPLQVIMIGEGLLPPELLASVAPLRGIAIYGESQSVGDLLPEITADSQVWRRCRPGDPSWWMCSSAAFPCAVLCPHPGPF